MTTSSSDNQPLRLEPVTQQTGSHCGPAVLQLLLAHHGLHFTQDQITKAAGVTQQIKKYGTRPEQLAKAVTKLAPQLQFWFKQLAKVQDVEVLINQYHLPVAINWKGLFYNSIEAEKLAKRRGDRGHYSVIIGVNKAQNTITVQDTYPEFSNQPREFALKWFRKRWRDDAIDTNPLTGKDEVINTRRFIFILAPKEATFPQELGMMLPEQLGILKVPTLSLKPGSLAE